MLSVTNTYVSNGQHGKIQGNNVLHFSSVIATVIKNPLTNISLSLDFLLDDITEKKRQYYHSIIKQNTERISQMVNALLSFNEKMNTSPEKHCLICLIDDILGEFKETVQRKRIQITKRHEQKEMKVFFSYPQMKTALTNIIKNAIESMRKSGGELTFITTALDGQQNLVVKDTGCGIHSVNLDYIFKPFFSTKEEQLGLGLATSYALLKNNHVKVLVESEVERGTSFTLLFPGENSL